MNDRITKWLLLLIAIGLLLNAAALFYQSLVPSAYAAGDRFYLEGGRLEVTLTKPVELRVDSAIPVEVTASRNLPVSVDGTVKIQGGGLYGDVMRVKVEDVVAVRQQP